MMLQRFPHSLVGNCNQEVTLQLSTGNFLIPPLFRTLPLAAIQLMELSSLSSFSFGGVRLILL